MATVKELLRAESDGTLSFGNYDLPTKGKVSDNGLTAIIKDGYEFVGLIVLSYESEFTFLESKRIPGHNSWEFVIMFLESKLVKFTINSGRRYTKSSGNIR